MSKAQLFPVGFVLGLVACLSAAPGFAGDLDAGVSGKGTTGTPAAESSSSRCPQNADGTFCWMSPDIGEAWAAGYTGSGVSITVVDDFTIENRFEGDLGHGTQMQRHGEWVAESAGMVAPGANMFKRDYLDNSSIRLQDDLNVINLSYELMEPLSQYPLERSIVDAARSGAAVVTKSAGNDGIAIGTPIQGNIDVLAVSLIGMPSAIFVGALDHNGTPGRKAELATYSNYAGSDPEVQNQFLTVGVESDKTGLHGTSQAAPVVSGYAAIVGSKFTSATPTQVRNQLLDTARTDTLVNYNPATYGRGEASLSRALAPASIR
ncbi:MULTISPECIES: S8/S53 family peptidase [Mesorhizobium]|uniref:S8/S53 family peptidase n=1 Tax=Mesorhizobium neociceri TaxID=1307853 RepID=A0A838BAJ0_9HYPH|nr:MULTISPECIES: S8/S53 family peptidase [Mesorhizobium]MBA1142370.1 S8/S53 family peptidase [Mesorhizobium neociceri]